MCHLTLDDGDLQRRGRRFRGASEAQSGWRPTGRSLGARRPDQGGLRLPERALCLLEQGAAGPRSALGSFGENFSVEGVDEESVCIGDEFGVGTAKLVVTEPRMPCFKLGSWRGYFEHQLEKLSR